MGLNYHADEREGQGSGGTAGSHVNARAVAYCYEQLTINTPTTRYDYKCSATNNGQLYVAGNSGKARGFINDEEDNAKGTEGSKGD